MKFGGKHTIQSKMKAAENRLGKTTGASKGSKPPPKPKVSPTIGKGKVGVKATWKF